MQGQSSPPRQSVRGLTPYSKALLYSSRCRLRSARPRLCSLCCYLKLEPASSTASRGRSQLLTLQLSAALRHTLVLDSPQRDSDVSVLFEGGQHPACRQHLDFRRSHSLTLHPSAAQRHALTLNLPQLSMVRFGCVALIECGLTLNLSAALRHALMLDSLQLIMVRFGYRGLFEGGQHPARSACQSDKAERGEGRPQWIRLHIRRPVRCGELKPPRPSSLK